MNTDITPPFGLPPFTHQTILAELARYPEIERAVVFGSRALGTYRRGSDVDICLFGEGVTPKIARHVSTRLNEELPIPYFFDVLAFDHIASQELRQHIERLGKELYRAGIAA
jgi:predicted nucleotidyltransferase